MIINFARFCGLSTKNKIYHGINNLYLVERFIKQTRPFATQNTSKQQHLNHRYVLIERPVNRSVQLTDFSLTTSPISELNSNEVLLKTLWLSLDPYMRGRMSAGKSYVQPVGIGEVMVGQGVAEVVKSNDPNIVPGQIVLADVGWQEYACLSSKDIIPIDNTNTSFPLSYYLGCLGMPGMTAYFALQEIGRPEKGETVLVSAASGAVGQIVGQIAKLKGCTVIGIAGGNEKCTYITKTLGFDSAIDYKNKSVKQLTNEIRHLAPNGINIYFDNVGGIIHDSAMLNLAIQGRVIICGVISTFDQLESVDNGPRWMRILLIKRALMQGFLVTDYEHRRNEFLNEMKSWLENGQLKYREDIAEGLQATPQAFIGMLQGKNHGKQLVRIAEQTVRS
ncbi:unnamed protein product [Didymodactylos carnosus]|uniref:15-oxoprostaglandin 13-reductase n=1 Tax=Didymodactylos carnosus TaxID=1234261 RepID=A0A814EZQ9_9BILA|nr:unnamed protein product [Didymodactylos carnosus]CAF3749022.1 unnamed protein product [Didymodactylos carnosus]